MPWPVSVVIPHQKSRGAFLRNFCVPSVEAAGAAQIVVVDRAGGACDKRNDGASKATQPYILFVDDDTILSGICLEKMVTCLEKEASAGFAYSNYASFPWPGIPDAGSAFVMKSRPFDKDVLLRSNYIDTTSLMRRDLFPGFDPRIGRLQDWDLWLCLMDQGVRGSFIDELLFMKFTLDHGISLTVPAGPATAILRQKHRLPP